MKLKRFTIENYKALGHVDVSIHDDLLFLIGVNGAGKSSLLQALSLIRYFAEGSLSAFFKDRGWRPSDARPKLARILPLRPAGSKPSTKGLGVAVSLALEHEEHKLLWSFEWNYSQLSTTSESIWIWKPDEKQPRLLFDLNDKSGGGGARFIAGDAFNLPGSVLSLIRPSHLAKSPLDIELLEELRVWAQSITSFDVLNPMTMRNNINLEGTGIGPQGERLASFLASLPSSVKSRVVERVAEFYPIRDLDTTRKRTGLLDMRVAEAFKMTGRVDFLHMSDGFLRILALCAIPEFDEEVGLILIDEVEDGIEPHILPFLIDRIVKESHAQIVMTSHSPLLINNFEPEQIFMLGRDKTGHTVGARAASLKPFRQEGDYFGSGEIWANADLGALNASMPPFRVPRRTISSEPSMQEVLRYLAGQ